ncbi:MAG: isoprenylcysteine carboxylmethyltransferase family protein [Acetobacteraceae bacterium]|nr:isoprenylcysteine carboxylmethyltransferase family protein [Acetobacteraceae bacterium]
MAAPVTALILMALAATGFALGNHRVARAIGRSPDVFGRGDGALDFLGRVHRAVFAASIGGLVLDGLLPGTTGSGGTLAAIVGWCGVLLLAAGAGLVLVAQRAMGTAWRVGIDAAPTTLVAEGLFAVSRNPTFLGMLGILLGAMMAAPNLLTAAALGAGIVGFSTQIRLEEAHLSALHGDQYRAYATRAPRWIGLRT